MDLSFEAEYTLFNCSTSIRVLSPANTGKLLIFVRWSKIVKAERSGKMKTKFSILTQPRRLLSYVKIVKAERSGKMKTKFSILTQPRRLLSYVKIVKAERSGKMKTKFSILTQPRRLLSYVKIVKAERSGKMKTKFSILTQPRRILPTHLCFPTNLRGFTFVNHQYFTNVSRFFPCLFTFVCFVFIQMYQRRVFCRQYFF